MDQNVTRLCFKSNGAHLLKIKGIQIRKFAATLRLLIVEMKKKRHDVVLNW